MIVKFTTWRHRSKVYIVLRINLNQLNRRFIRLDLTKSRYNILKEARKLILTREGKPTELGVNGPLNFIFVAKMKDHSFVYYETLEQFMKIAGLVE